MTGMELKDIMNAIDEDIQNVIREHMNRYHMGILEDIIRYAWSDFYYTEHEAEVIRIIQERFSISQEDRDTVELKVLKEISKAAAKSKDYQAGYNVYSRWLEIDPDSKEAKKGLDICKKGLEKAKTGKGKGQKEEETEEMKAPEEVVEEKEVEEKTEEPEAEKEEKEAEETQKEEKKEDTSQPSAPEGPKPEPHPEYPCHTCGKPLYWIPQYQRWYCYTCQKYM